MTRKYRHPRSTLTTPKIVILDARRWGLLFVALLGTACESLEGSRVVVAPAEISILVPSNWESRSAPARGEGEAVFEANPRTLRQVRVKVLAQRRAGVGLEDLVKQTLADVSQLEKKGTLRVKDVTEVPLRRGHLEGRRVLHQLELGATRQGDVPIALTQISDLYAGESLGVIVLAFGPKADVETVGPELDRILGSIQGLQPPPDTPRVYPPSAVTSRWHRTLQRLLSSGEVAPPSAPR